jgi:hypothetical protein
MRLKYAMRDPHIGLSGDLDIPQVLLPPKAIPQCQHERLLPRAAGVKDGLVDIEKDELGFNKFSIFDFRLGGEMNRGRLANRRFLKSAPSSPDG